MLSDATCSWRRDTQYRARCPGPLLPYLNGTPQPSVRNRPSGLAVGGDGGLYLFDYLPGVTHLCTNPVRRSALNLRSDRPIARSCPDCKVIFYTGSKTSGAWIMCLSGRDVREGQRQSDRPGSQLQAGAGF